MTTSSTARDIARMVTDFLGPSYPRGNGSVGATLNALRTRLETDTTTYDTNRDKLAWDVREAIRTEFFKIIYPADPSDALLSLVTRTEILLTNPPLAARPLFTPNRPFFFPGGRVTVPTEAGSRRAGTTLQLRFKESPPPNPRIMIEALLHLDGPNGGGFQWVQSQALAPHAPYGNIASARRAIKPPLAAPLRPPTRPAPAAARPRIARATARPARPRVTNRQTAAQKREARKAAQAKIAQAKAAEAAEKKKQAVAAAAAKLAAKPPPRVIPPPPPPPPPPTGPVALPPTFVPDALLTTSPPPRKRLRVDFPQPVSHSAGGFRQVLDGGVVGEGDGKSGKGRVRNVVGVSRLAARRVVEQTGVVEYFVIWTGKDIREGTWERRSALLIDVPALVADFDTRHPDLPASVCHSDRVLAQAEVEDLAKKEVQKEEGKDDNMVDVAEEERQGSVPAGTSESGTDAKPTEEQPTTKPDPAPDTGKKYKDELTGIEIPSYLDTPILELFFSGMVLQIRRPDEYTLHNDAASASRDYKKRQSRFKQESVFQAEKLFALSKTEAKSALEASLRVHKAYNRHPIAFPRGLGQVTASDTGVPFTSETLASEPPSWESYLSSVGLRSKHFQRDLPRFYPTLDERATQQMLQVANDQALERVVEHRERARRIVRASYRHINGAVLPPPRALFRDGVRRVRECQECYGGGEGEDRKVLTAKVPAEKVEKGSDAAVAQALARAGAVVREEERWYDAYWSCWRAGYSPMGGG